MKPDAFITHRTDNRIRIKIPSRRGDMAYFTGLRELFADADIAGEPEFNAVTATLLFSGDSIDESAIASFADEKGLFALFHSHPEPKPVAYHIAEPINTFSSFLSRFTLGRLDMPSIAFLVCVGVGIRQIAIGNFVAPPWYTAFWYAFGVFSKSLADKAEYYKNESLRVE